MGRPTPRTTSRFNTRVDYVFSSDSFDKAWTLTAFNHFPYDASDHSFVVAEFDVLKRRLNLHKHINYNHERVIAHFWTEFAINENLMFCCCAYSAAHQMRVRLSTQLKLNRKKNVFCNLGKRLNAS